MRARHLFCLILTALLAIPAPSALACSRVLGVKIDCEPTPTPSPTKAVTKTTTTANPVGALFAAIQRERARRGLPKLAFDRTVAAVAESHASRMAEAGKLYHNRRLGEAALRRRLGNPDVVLENVGYGPTATKLHKAFMNSPSHRRAILYPRARVVGIGLVRKGSELWISQVFQDRHAPGGRASDPPRSRKENTTSGALDETVLPVEPPQEIFASEPLPERPSAPGLAPLMVAGSVGAGALLFARRKRV